MEPVFLQLGNNAVELGVTFAGVCNNTSFVKILCTASEPIFNNSLNAKTLARSRSFILRSPSGDKLTKFDHIIDLDDLPGLEDVFTRPSLLYVSLELIPPFDVPDSLAWTQINTLCYLINTRVNSYISQPLIIFINGFNNRPSHVFAGVENSLRKHYSYEISRPIYFVKSIINKLHNDILIENDSVVVPIENNGYWVIMPSVQSSVENDEIDDALNYLTAKLPGITYASAWSPLIAKLGLYDLLINIVAFYSYDAGKPFVHKYLETGYGRQAFNDIAMELLLISGIRNPEVTSELIDVYQRLIDFQTNVYSVLKFISKSSSQRGAINRSRFLNYYSSIYTDLEKKVYDYLKNKDHEALPYLTWFLIEIDIIRRRVS